MSATTDEISDSARSILETVLTSLPRVEVAATILGVGWVLSRLVRWVLHGTLQRRQTRASLA